MYVFMVVLNLASAGLGFCDPRALQATFHPAHLRNWLTKEKNEAHQGLHCTSPGSSSKVWPRLLGRSGFMKGLGSDHSQARCS